VEEIKLSKPYWILRYLHYFGDQQEGAEIAAPHTDNKKAHGNTQTHDIGFNYTIPHEEFARLFH
jgi:hypothetical protein